MPSRLQRSLLITLLGSCAAFAQGYKMTGSIDVGGKGGWDYLSADSQNRKLYVSHGSEVDVIDLDTQKPAGKIEGLNRIHGIWAADDLGVGFITDGGANEVVVFNLKDLSIKNRVKTGTNPDGGVYDSATKRFFAFNGRSGDATAVDAESGAVAGTIKLDGKPEFPVSDGKGNIYDNLEDKSEIVRIDAKTLAVTAHWPLAPCESPSGLAIDKSTRRLFAVCDNKMMAVVDADSGKVIATPTVGEGPDAAAFDPGTKLAFSSNGQSGTVTVVRENSEDKFSVLENVKTERGARTIALDEKTHKLYLPTAQFGAAPAATATNAHPRPTMVPDTFKILVVGK
ncbi:MAG: YncE family protein [Acidobacteriota bacterium]|nr:YncE family protein [Acidobacteriota bacterium]